LIDALSLQAKPKRKPRDTPMAADTRTVANPLDWIGCTRGDADHIDLNRARALHAMFGARGPEPRDGSPIPPLGHWLYFWDMTPPDGLGHDGHAHRGGFLPPIELPRRMWAGSRVRFLAPLRVGTTAHRRSTIANVQMKSGGSGRLAVVTVRTEIGDGATLAVVDEQDNIYREPSPIRTPAAAGGGEPLADAVVEHRMTADPVLLFRYSALTFNGHRIHYDRSYATGHEQYPGLVVHGPLLATLMVQAACEARPDADILSFGFRAQSPIFDIDEFRVRATRSDTAGEIETAIIDPRGAIAFRGTATFT
jgi:3-methylfumaryl-CoA hydratase